MQGSSASSSASSRRIRPSIRSSASPEAAARRRLHVHQPKPRSEREEAARPSSRGCAPQLARVTGVSCPESRAGSARRRAAVDLPYQYTLKSDNLDDLRRWAARLADAMREQPELTDVDTDQQQNGVETFGDNRPRQRCPARRDGARRGHGALQQLRPAVGGDDLRRDQQ